MRYKGAPHNATMAFDMTLLRTLSLMSTALLVGCATPDPMCPAIVAFANAQKDGPARSVTLLTDWGGPLSSARNAIFVKECHDGGYAPGHALCKVLFEHTSTEFPDGNFHRALVCLGGDRFPVTSTTHSDYIHARLWMYPPEAPAGWRVGVQYDAGIGQATPTLVLTVEPY